MHKSLKKITKIIDDYHYVTQGMEKSEGYA